LELVSQACASANIACRLVQRRTETAVRTLAEAGLE